MYFFEKEEKYAQRIMLVTEKHRRYTYRDVYRMQDEMTDALPARSLVLILCRNAVPCIVMQLGLLRKNMVPVLMDAHISASFLQELIESYRVNAIFLPEERSGDLPAHEELWAGDGYRLCAVRKAGPVLAPALAMLVPVSDRAESLQMIRYSRDNLQAGAKTAAALLKVLGSDRMITNLPVHLPFPMTMLYSHVLRGAGVLVTELDVMDRGFWQFFHDEEATVLCAFPHTCRMLRRMHFDQMHIPSLRVFAAGGGELPSDLRNDLISWATITGIRFFCFYGRAEAAGFMANLSVFDRNEPDGSIGNPEAFGQIECLGPDGRPVKNADRPARMVYYGDNVSLGYARNADDLRRSDENGGRLVTGELAVLSEAGTCKITGRTERFLKVTGIRVDLEALEAMLSEKWNRAFACMGTDDFLEVFAEEKQVEDTEPSVRSTQIKRADRVEDDEDDGLVFLEVTVPGPGKRRGRRRGARHGQEMSKGPIREISVEEMPDGAVREIHADYIKASAGETDGKSESSEAGMIISWIAKRLGIPKHMIRFAECSQLPETGQTSDKEGFMVYNTFGDMQLSALGMGAMRLPVLDGDDTKINEEATQEMVDYAMANGINYYDTAWGYHGGNSELVMGKALKKHARDSFYLATKFPGYDLGNMPKVKEIFAEQLKKCQVEYFDFYLVHNVCELNINEYLDDAQFGVVSYLKEMKEQGKIRHLGFSAHGSIDVMRRFLDAYGKDMEFCQIQLNYLDYKLQDAKGKLALLKEWNLPVWVMEPLRGGRLAKLTEQEEAMLRAMRPDESVPAWAFRFLQSIPEVVMTLSGMSDFAQMKDNIETFSTSAPLNEKEWDGLMALTDAMLKKDTVPCTACHYCTSHCPQELDIPGLLKLYNEHCFTGGGFIVPMALGGIPRDKRPQACIGCRSCEAVCPQQIKISEALADFTKRIEESKQE